MRILIVDDDQVSRMQLKKLLSPYGDCDAAPTGALGVAMYEASHAEKRPYRLITMDVQLPDMDGKDAVSAIRKWEDDNRVLDNRGETSILMISVSGNGHTIFESFRKGGEGYLVKPVTPEKIKAALKNLSLVVDAD